MGKGWYGLIGRPVSHSLSPAIQATFAAYYGEAMDYRLLEAESAAETVSRAYAAGALGLNVTAPHKRAVIPALESLDALSVKIGACNTLVRTERGFSGRNTDVYGIGRAVSRLCPDSDGTAVIIGAGGSAAAAAMALLEQYWDRIYIMNRSRDAAEALVKLMDSPRVGVLPGERIGGIQLAVQCTPAEISASCLPEMPDAALDLTYAPRKTRFLAEAERAGSRTENGMGALIYQGAKAYELWTGRTLPEDYLEDILMKNK